MAGIFHPAGHTSSRGKKTQGLPRLHFYHIEAYDVEIYIFAYIYGAEEVKKTHCIFLFDIV